MPTLAQLTIAQSLVFILVVCRIGGLVAMAPAFGAFALPWRFRAMLAIAIALVVAPVCGASPSLTTISATAQFACQFALLAGGELLMGVVLGLGVAILLSSAQIAGQWISQLCGVSLSEVLQPEGGEATSAHTQLLYLLALAVYVALGGQRLLIGALLESFRQLPPGTAISVESLGATLLALVSQSFQLGIRGAAPALGALLLSTIGLTIAGRSVPQLNVLSLGLGVNCLVALSVLVGSIGLTAHLSGNQLEPTLTELVEKIIHGDGAKLSETSMSLAP